MREKGEEVGVGRDWEGGRKVVRGRSGEKSVYEERREWEGGKGVKREREMEDVCVGVE